MSKEELPPIDEVYIQQELTDWVNGSGYGDSSLKDLVLRLIREDRAERIKSE